MKKNDKLTPLSPEFRNDIERAKKKLEEMGFQNVTLKEGAELIRFKSKQIMVSDRDIEKFIADLRKYGRI